MVSMVVWSQCKDMLSTGCTNTIDAYSPRLYGTACMLEGPRKHVFSRKILRWMTPIWGY